MKLPISRARRLVCLLGLLGLIVAATAMLTNGPAAARPGRPGPLCGWTTIWDCTLPDGSHETVIGTQCDILEFERKNRATCTPATF